MDVKDAYLNAPLDEDIYMQQPAGFNEKGKESFVCLLQKSLYSLKQAGRLWYE
jgi:Reverse transcriptase (RNA-dependent DNA polymerase)